MSFRAPKNGYAFPDHLMRPPVMAIGDSIYNGMRSATITAEFAAKSVPAGVARVIAPDYAFRAPRYPEPLLLDLEQTLREIDLGDLIGRLRSRIQALVANAQRWGRGDHVVPLDHATWDNLSISGALVEDLIERDWGHWDALVRANLPKLKDVDTVAALLEAEFDPIDLHMGLNGKFLLNPNDRDELKEMRPIDLVAARGPKHLLVNIGANHGIIDITLRAVEAMAEPPAGTGLRSLSLWPEKMRALAEMLVALPKETETIFVNTVPLPSSVPNMMPPYNPREVELHQIEQSRGFYPVYDNRLGGLGDYHQYSARKMRELDRQVRAINEEMIRTVQAVFDAAGDDRVRFFRLDKALKRFDGKHVDKKCVRDADPGVDLEFRRRTYSNKAIDFDNSFLFDFLDSFREGGVASLDNHHPSGLGYAIMTRELLREMKKTVPGIKLTKAPISEQGDRLFSDPPGEFASLVRILYKLRRRKAGFRSEPDLDEARGEALPSTETDLTLSADETEVEALGEILSRIMRTKGR